MQMVSHEFAHLVEDERATLLGDKYHIDRLTLIALFVRKWYLIASIIFATLISLLGILALKKNEFNGSTNLMFIWIALVALTAINLRLSPYLAMMEGMSNVGQVARLRVIQSILGYLLLWGVFYFKGSLYGLLALPFTSVICTCYFLKRHSQTLRWISCRELNELVNLNWLKEIFPLQWRIAISWISGYFVFNLFTPIVFLYYGSVEAGRIGLALSLFSSVTAVGMSWVNAKAPSFTMYISLGENEKLRNLFWVVFHRSFFFIIFVSILVIFSVATLDLFNARFILRLPSLNILIVIALANIINSVVFSMATFMRAYKEEPMLLQSLTMSLLVVTTIVFVGKASLFAMMLSYMLLTLAISLPWTIYLFRKYYLRSNRVNEYHSI